MMPFSKLEGHHIVLLSEEDQAMATGNMYMEFAHCYGLYACVTQKSGSV